MRSSSVSYYSRCKLVCFFHLLSQKLLEDNCQTKGKQKVYRGFILDTKFPCNEYCDVTTSKRDRAIHNVFSCMSKNPVTHFGLTYVSYVRRPVLEYGARFIYQAQPSQVISDAEYSHLNALDIALC